MAFWSRLRQSKLKFGTFSNEFKRCYTLNHTPIVANQHISSCTLIPILNNPNFVAQGGQFEFFSKVRFYAAPVQVHQKKEEKDESGPLLNEQITPPTVRLVAGDDHFVISRYEALARAKRLNMDLVLVDRVAKPPVCKIFDYHKEKYVQQLKEKERSKSKSTLKKGACKEIRFAAKIKPKDLQIKADTVKRLMESGYRVKCTAIEPTNDLDLATLLSHFSALIEDIAVSEGGPHVEKKQAYVVVRHIKFGPPKKGSGKKANVAGTAQAGSQENGETAEAGLETEHSDSKELSDEDSRIKKSEWAVFDGDDDIHTVFDINNQDNGPPRNSKQAYSANRNPRNIIESTLANTASSIPIGGPKQAMENRYARDPRPRNPPQTPIDMNSSGARNAMNGAPQIPNQGKQPQFSMNPPPQMRPPRQVEVPHGVFNQDSSRPNSPTKGYGIFGGPQANATPHEQNQPAGSNRYKKSDPSDSTRNPRSTGLPPHRNPPRTDSRTQRGPSVDSPGQGSWGVFSKDNSNAEIQRR